jgi:COP9 signalosome complex subunit 2
VNGLLEVGGSLDGIKKYTAMDKWAGQLKTLHTAILNKLA